MTRVASAAILSGALLLLMGWALGWARCRAVTEDYAEVQPPDPWTEALAAWERL